MQGVSRNILANIAGKGFSAFVTLVFVPLYIRLLGMEAYGLIGFFATLQTVFLLADVGLSATFTRETARLSAIPGKAREMRDLCRTFELICFALGFAITLAILATSQTIAQHWVKPDHLSVTAISIAIKLMGLTIGLQLPFVAYQGGLLGLQRQVPLNVLGGGIGLLRGLGAVAVLSFFAKTIEAFFVWQALASVVQLIIARNLLWHSLPPDARRAQFSFSLVRTIWRFATGMAAIAVTSVVLTQVDKIILSKMLPLEVFGYYSLAGVVAGIPYLLAAPINNAIYPRLTQLAAVNDISQLKLLYHRACQLVASVTIPVGLLLALFSREIILLWTGSATTAHHTAPLATVLVVGSTLLALMYIPYALQLAYAWTNLPLQINVAAIAILVPLLIWLTGIWGPIGACLVWVALNVGYVLITIQLMHRRLLPADKSAWYIDDVLKPFVAAFAVVGFGWLFHSNSLPTFLTIGYLGIILLAAISAAAISAPLTRGAIFARLLPAFRAWHSR